MSPAPPPESDPAAAWSWRYRPLDVATFPLGTGPFRVRGQAFDTALLYVDRKLVGGRAAFLVALGEEDPFAPYYAQTFVVGADYDLSPLVRLYQVVSGLEGVPVGDFIEARSRWSAGADARGMWKRTLATSSPEALAERLHIGFNRYFFEPSRARTLGVSPGRFECELSKLPAPMDGLHVRSTMGWVTAALEGGGAEGVGILFDRPAPDGELSGVPLERVRFVATWTV